MSELVFSERLGRHLRTGSAAELGVPTSRLAVEALAGGRPSAASELVRYLVEETERIYGIYATWLGELRAYGEARVPELDAHYAQIADALGAVAPMQRRASGHEEALSACEAAIAAGDPAALDRALDALRERLRVVHDAQADWCWALLTRYRDLLGEDQLDDVLRVTEEPWVTPRYAALAEMTSHELLELTVEGMRGHLSGPGRTGEVRIDEDEEKYVLSFDPCGSGGRMRRGDPAHDQPPAAARPELFGASHGAHDWSWGRADVCLYCAHCAVVNEILPIERLGKPMRVTDHPTGPDEPCRWTLYKSRDAIPEAAYRRVGKQPNADSAL